MKKAERMIKFFGIIATCVFMSALAVAGEIKIALDTPPDLEKSGTYVWAKAFGDHLRANGLKVNEFPIDALGGEEEKLDQVSQGLLEVSLSDLAKAGQLDATIFGFYLPYLFDSISHMDRVVANSDLMARVNIGTGKKGVHVLALVPLGGFMGLANTKRPIRTPADLKGMRIRSLDKAQAQYFEALGASTVVIPWAEIYNALQTGVADGYLNPPTVPVLFKHTDVIKYFSDLKFNAPLRVAICSNTWYKGLSKKDREIVDEAVVKANAANRTWGAKVEKSALDMLRKAGVNVYVPTEEERSQFAKLVRPILTCLFHNFAVR